VYTFGAAEGRGYERLPRTNQTHLLERQPPGSEEGEVSENASEDLYEPEDLEVADQYEPKNNGYLGDENGVRGTTGRFRSRTWFRPPICCSHSLTLAAPERSGSYSPYLSPQEMELSKDASSQADPGT
jgi:hypothetical protein